MSTVDLNQILEMAKGSERLKRLSHAQIGTPWYQLDRLKISVIQEEWSQDQPNDCHAIEENGYLKIEKSVISKVGCKLTICDGLVLGYEKSVEVTGPTQKNLVPLKIRPGKPVTENMDTVNITVCSRHSNPSLRLAKDFVEEYRFKGQFELKVKLSGNVTFIDQSGNRQTDLPFAEIVSYLNGSPAVSCLMVHYEQDIPHHVTWTIKGDADIYGPLKQSIVWQ